MEPSTCKTSESEEDSVEEEESEEECVKEEDTTPSNSSQQALSKADYKAFENGDPLAIIAKKIPKKIIAPTDTDDLEVGRRKRRRKRRPLSINLTNCKYESVRRAAQMCGLKEVGEDEEWTVYWTDCSVSLERVMDMKRFQPFLIDGFKFDMRIYVLITSCDPLRIFMYEEGLARFATMPYVEPSHNNLEDVCMHLTNYAINKHNENFVRDDASISPKPHPNN
uniref:Tubulin tyrosine ligase like 13 n=1 Tax=Marmota marmota marmota TaxID=9994 RepID=A0A8C5ZZH5_MARMA